MTALRTPVDPTDAQSVLDTLALSVGDATGWEVKSSAAGYLEIGPTAGSAIPNFRILIAFGINSAQRQEPHDATAVNAGELWMGIAPDGGTLGDPFGASDPYGVARWSLYWRCSGLITAGADADNVFCLVSDEVFSFWLNEAAPEDWYGGLAGAYIDPPTDSDGEGGTPGRVYGMLSTGRTLISNTFWSGGNDFMNSAGGGTSNTLGCFRPSRPTKWTILDRTTEGTANADTEGGTRISMPVLVYQAGATTVGSPGATNPTNAVGILRQIRKTSDNKMRVIVQDGGSANKSFIVAGSTSANYDAASFDQG
jgi:hypothetical protein